MRWMQQTICAWIYKSRIKRVALYYLFIFVASKKYMAFLPIIIALGVPSLSIRITLRIFRKPYSLSHSCILITMPPGFRNSTRGGLEKHLGGCPLNNLGVVLPLYFPVFCLFISFNHTCFGSIFLIFVFLWPPFKLSIVCFCCSLPRVMHWVGIVSPITDSKESDYHSVAV